MSVVKYFLFYCWFFGVFSQQKYYTETLYILLVLCFFTPKKKYRSVWLLFSANSAIVHRYIMAEQVNFQWDDDEALFVLDQHFL